MDAAVGDGGRGDGAAQDGPVARDGGMDARDGDDPGLVVDPGNTGCGCGVPGARERAPRGIAAAVFALMALGRRTRRRPVRRP